MELLATVHWLVQHEGVTDADQAFEATHAWNERKKRFTPRQNMSGVRPFGRMRVVLIRVSLRIV